MIFILFVISNSLWILEIESLVNRPISIEEKEKNFRVLSLRKAPGPDCVFTNSEGSDKPMIIKLIQHIGKEGSSKKIFLSGKSYSSVK